MENETQQKEVSIDIGELKEVLENSAQEVKVVGTTQLKNPQQLQAEREFKNWKETKIDYSPIKQFKIPTELLNCLIKTKEFNGLIFSGEGGIGKTCLTMATIKSMLKSDEWNYFNGYTTPLSLYEFLYENRNRKVIILDDTEGVFNNSISLAILKSVLWVNEGERLVQYNSTSDKATTPRQFIMKAKVILLCNAIPNKSDISTRAMISRTIYYEIGFSFKEKIKICKEFIEKDNTINKEDKILVLKILEEEVNEATKDFNFRTLRKLIAFVEYDKKKARNLFKETNETDELKEAYLNVVGRFKQVKSQISLFIELTGRSRATFFRVKKTFEKSQSRKKKVCDTKTKKCPNCKIELTKYRDYSGDWWLGCDKCEEYEVFLKKGNANNGK